MTREEAIKVAIEMYGWLKTDREKEALETLIPELRESEDERIRTELLSSFKGIMADADEDELWYGLPYNDIIAWLEKQKEQKPADLSEMMVHKEPYIAPVPTPMVADEQKPAEWSEEDDAYRIEAVKLLENPSLYESCPNLRQETIEWLKQLPKVSVNSEQVSVNSEWSEEDERRKDVVIQWLREYQKEFNPKYDSQSIDSIESLINWLKSLRPQPKQEWSDEDERKLQKCIKIVERWEEDYDIAYAPYSGMLKSLRPSWKPSDEQMKALKNSAYGSYQNGDGPVLRELYEQLNKLI